VRALASTSTCSLQRTRARWSRRSGPSIAGAILHPREAHCDPSDFTAALVEGARSLGADIRTGVETRSLRRSNGRVVELQTSAGVLRPGAIVLAAGAWTKALAAQAGIHVPLEGGKGYHLELPGAGERQPQLPMFLEEARVTATPLAGRLRLTGTLELSGLDLRVDPSPRGSDRPCRAARARTAASSARRRVWRGLRPCAPDGLPIVGAPEGVANLYLATGHAMLGIALAPVTGEMVADLVTGDAPRHEAAAFSPARFRRVRQAMKGRELMASTTHDLDTHLVNGEAASLADRPTSSCARRSSPPSSPRGRCYARRSSPSASDSGVPRCARRSSGCGARGT
jgi:D-amino-acid dehydrogenase